MRSILRLAVLMGMLLALGVAPAQALTLDQSQTDTGGPPASVWHGERGAQTFTAGKTGTITRVDLPLAKFESTDPFTSPLEPLTVEIRNTVAGVPGTDVMATGTVTPAQVGPDPSSPTWVSITLAPVAPLNAAVAAGTRYAIALYSATAAGPVGDPSTYLWGRSPDNSNPYPDGEAFRSFAFQPGAWAAFSPPFDFAFKTHVTLASRPAVVNASTNWLLRDSLTSGPPTTTFSYGTRPLSPIMGDWDGDGTETPGTFEGGTFKLRNANSPGTPDITFAFGDSRGFPLAGDWDGDGDDDVGVYRNGVWQLRSQSGELRSFGFGSGSWPNTVPVAGDWDGDGTDGIGTYTLASGSWSLRNSPSAGPADIGPFVYWQGSGSYPVVGDWDADGTDTVGVKKSVTWYLNNTNDGGAPDITFDYGGANDLPLSFSSSPCLSATTC